ncbi:hypothetical protein [Gottfriedia acidiceleris]|uniref:hypothetical protein n=1 Tax=Gottfriedia acidiceleris TaxID=371036 RepID=UPI00101D2F4C|nr:hypothetical protein [Gottfriedia acidiceleris]
MKEELMKLSKEELVGMLSNLDFTLKTEFVSNSHKASEKNSLSKIYNSLFKYIKVKKVLS